MADIGTIHDRNDDGSSLGQGIPHGVAELCTVL